jgi:hypothetical protein
MIQIVELRNATGEKAISARNEGNKGKQCKGKGANTWIRIYFFRIKVTPTIKWTCAGCGTPQKGVFRRPPLAAVPGAALGMPNGDLGGGILSPSVGRS